MPDLEPRSPVTGWGSGGGGAPSAHATTHEPGGADPLTAFVLNTARGAANGVGSLTAAGRQPTGEAPLVTNPIRLGNVSSTVTSDAASGAGNLINLNVNGNITIVAPINPTDHQVLEHHCVAVGADRQVTFTGTAYVLAGAATLGPYTVPRGKVLVARSAYLGNRATVADVAAPAWGLISAEVSDAPRMTAPHAGQHAVAGSDPVTPAAIGAAAAAHDHDDTTASKTASYTLVAADDVVFFDTTSGALTATLPTAVGRAGHVFTVKKTGVNPLIIAAAGAETIDGVNTETISMLYGYRSMISDGTRWHVIGGRIDPVIATLADVGVGGTVTVNASAATLYRGRVTGATANFAAPTNPIDGDVVNVELFATVACTVTMVAAIIETGGLPAAFAIPINTVLYAALRYRAATSPVTVAAGWRLLAASIEN